MLFNSIHYLIFFPLVTAMYFLSPQRVRWALLLAASCYFYMVFKPVYILILAFTIFIDYAAGIWIEESQGQRRKWFLIASIVTNVGVLAIFKYYNFVNQSWHDFLSLTSLDLPVPPFLQIMLPIGLSFHTFQSMSYTIEVYRRHTPAERHLGVFALYVMFYPQLVAGPIERPQHVLPQLKETHFFEYSRAVSGLQLMLWGMFKKVVIADRLAPFANEVYGQPQLYEGISLIVATVFFAVQIYCDFSGYSDIALGSAQVMGIKLMQNFDRPYFSKSIAEFWRRWHISLSSWFRDYLYVSLGGNRVLPLRRYFNVLVTFTVSGIWHGANWTYVLWGVINGMYLIGERQYQSVIEKHIVPRLTNKTGLFLFQGGQVVLTFGMICLAWIFFRANTISDAGYILTHLFSGLKTLPADLFSMPFVKLNILLGRDKFDFIAALCGIAFLIVTHLLQRKESGRALLGRQNVYVRWAFYYAIICSILFLGAYNESQQFIYFQF